MLPVVMYVCTVIFMWHVTDIPSTCVDTMLHISVLTIYECFFYIIKRWILSACFLSAMLPSIQRITVLSTYWLSAVVWPACLVYNYYCKMQLVVLCRGDKQVWLSKSQRLPYSPAIRDYCSRLLSNSLFYWPDGSLSWIMQIHTHLSATSGRGGNEGIQE